MEQINTVLADMPTTIRAYTIACTDGTYTIVLNSKHCYETLRKAYAHEISHIMCGDCEIQTDVGVLEHQRHSMYYQKR